MTLSRAPPMLSGSRRSSRSRNWPLWLNDAAGCAALQPTQRNAGKAVTHIDPACSRSACRLSGGTDLLFDCSVVTGHLGLWMGVGSGRIKMTSPPAPLFKQWLRGTEGLIAALTREFGALRRRARSDFNGSVHYCMINICAAVLTVRQYFPCANVMLKLMV